MTSDIQEVKSGIMRIMNFSRWNIPRTHEMIIDGTVGFCEESDADKALEELVRDGLLHHRHGVYERVTV